MAGCFGCCCPPDPDSVQLISPRERKSSDGQRAPVRRSCTDCFCMLLFAVVLAAAVMVSKAAIRVGNPDRLTNGVDYMGGLCGRGSRAHLPYVFYPRLGDDLRSHQDLLSTAPWAVPLYGLCVDKCPAQGEQVLDYGCKHNHPECRWRENPLVTWCAIASPREFALPTHWPRFDRHRPRVEAALATRSLGAGRALS